MEICLNDPNNTSLEILNVEHNLLFQIDVQISLVNLKTLNLCKNSLTRLPNDVFLHIPNLKTLDLSQNQLTEIPKSITSLSKLEMLDLQDNRIKEAQNSLFLNFKHLDCLYLNDNLLTIPPDLTFCVSLSRVWFQHNRIRFMTFNPFELLQLRLLALEDNSFDFVFQNEEETIVLNDESIPHVPLCSLKSLAAKKYRQDETKTRTDSEISKNEQIPLELRQYLNEQQKRCKFCDSIYFETFSHAFKRLPTTNLPILISFCSQTCISKVLQNAEKERTQDILQGREGFAISCY